MPEKQCAECGTTFQYKASQPDRLCCSMSCAGKHRARRLKSEGRLYQPVKPRRGQERPCAVCGKPVYSNASQAAKGQGRYCSRACHDIAQTKEPVLKACAYCGAEMTLKPSQAARRFCSKACEADGLTVRPLDRMHNGRRARMNAAGYVLVYEPTHPNKSFHGWQFEHRLVVEAVVDRYLASDEHVHHINGVKDDNRPENLEVMAANDHAALSATDYRDKVRRDQAELAEYRRRYGPLDEQEE